MSLRENKELARRLFDEVWSRGRFELAGDLLVSDFVGRPAAWETRSTVLRARRSS